ncbi:hypothetical protein GCM10009745_57870 [Kribbella yunnanensis]|uniref:Dihydrofolate reductase n=1 Tax=Kribbella yunnanensis TaxID=190194 RepID=A0ABP4UCH4_9ACTN
MTALPDTEPQTAAGKVLWHFTISLDGFVAGPNHAMDWMGGITNPRPNITDEYTSTTGAILGGRDGFEAANGPFRAALRASLCRSSQVSKDCSSGCSARMLARSRLPVNSSWFSA